MTQRERVLEMLEEAGDVGVTTADFLAAYIPRFSARVEELREAGYSITSERLRGSSWRYTLREPETAHPATSGSLSVNRTADALFELEPSSTTYSAVTGKPLP